MSLPSSPPGRLGAAPRTQTQTDQPSGVGEGLAAPSPLREPSEPVARASEWKGNLVLFAAIALLVALATFVLERERLADVRVRSPQEPSKQAPAAE